MDPNSSGYKQGTISVQNAAPAGVATTGSAVELDLGGKYRTVGIQVTGTYAVSALSVQYTIDGTNWITIAGTVVGNSIEDITAGTAAAAIAAAAVGIRRINSAGMGKIRVTALGAITGSAVVTLVATN